MGCHNNGGELIGDWKVISNFHKTTCRIQEVEGSLKGLILQSDDGTTQYQYDGIKPQRFLFENLKKRNNQYIDAVSGATTKDGETPSLSIEVKNMDTLMVTTYSLNRPLTEIWTRK